MKHSAPTLFDLGPTFHGADLDAEDVPRLERQLDKVIALMSDGKARTLAQIAMACGCEPQSASARLRQMRNDLGYTVERRKDEKRRGLFFYKATRLND